MCGRTCKLLRPADVASDTDDFRRQDDGIRPAGRGGDGLLMAQKPWTLPELDYILRHYGRGRDAEIAAELGRTLISVQKKFYYLGGRKPKPKRRRTVPPAARAGFAVLVAAMVAGRLEF